MTVKELIEILQEYPQNYTIGYDTNFGQNYSFEKIDFSKSDYREFVSLTTLWINVPGY